ncbi:hypothetical protein [Scytonema hofmannii]|nr:hypothetical protein [Scytonema hofmannii]
MRLLLQLKERDRVWCCLGERSHYTSHIIACVFLLKGDRAP